MKVAKKVTKTLSNGKEASYIQTGDFDGYYWFNVTPIDLTRKEIVELFDVADNPRNLDDRHFDQWNKLEVKVDKEAFDRDRSIHTTKLPDGKELKTVVADVHTDHWGNKSTKYKILNFNDFTKEELEAAFKDKGDFLTDISKISSDGTYWVDQYRD